MKAGGNRWRLVAEGGLDHARPPCRQTPPQTPEHSRLGHHHARVLLPRSTIFPSGPECFSGKRLSGTRLICWGRDGAHDLARLVRGVAETMRLAAIEII